MPHARSRRDPIVFGGAPALPGGLSAELLATRARAQVIVWVVVMLPFFLAIAGLSIDAGVIFDARRDAQNIADGAARVAAVQLDVPKLRSSGNVVLNSNDAAAAARTYIASQEQGAGWNPPGIAGDGTYVQVTVSRQVPTTFMRIVNVNSLVTVSASARATPCYGVVGTGTRSSGGQC